MESSECPSNSECGESVPRGKRKPGWVMAAAAIEALNRQRSLSRSPYLVPSDAQNQHELPERNDYLLRWEKYGSWGYDVGGFGDGNALRAVVVEKPVIWRRSV